MNKWVRVKKGNCRSELQLKEMELVVISSEGLHSNWSLAVVLKRRRIDKMGMVVCQQEVELVFEGLAVSRLQGSEAAELSVWRTWKMMNFFLLSSNGCA
ncbi:hypothetical protein C5167_049064 [Papaver somniferum]|uniref:Uncharacterized protein n=1 Tax=Papaver somniferum TaxID=3469 RepID=A0A4Y7KMG4_PAPSO|nr:hypothetical protein C5167_049064 [Papaver somniferum]